MKIEILEIKILYGSFTRELSFWSIKISRETCYLQNKKNNIFQYHPDKLGRPATKKDEEIFAVITKSADLLTDPVWRPRFDSIDPKFDDSLPKGQPKKLRENFYDIFK